MKRIITLIAILTLATLASCTKEGTDVAVVKLKAPTVEAEMTK
jgi:hypothetical protein